MTNTTPDEDDVLAELPPIDRLLTRPDTGPLPTMLDPDSDVARGGAADPKPKPRYGSGDPRETNPKPDDLGRSA